jgi:hypothetical protein
MPLINTSLILTPLYLYEHPDNINRLFRTHCVRTEDQDIEVVVQSGHLGRVGVADYRRSGGFVLV